VATINLYNIDCMEFMKGLPDKSYDLAIVDPPYGINAPNMQMGANLSRTKNGYPAESTASRLKKGRLNQGSGKLKNRALNTMNCDWDMQKPSPDYFKELFRITKNQIIWGGNYFTDNLPVSRCWVCWDKVQPWENFSQFELAWTSFDKPAAIFRYSNTGGANAETKIHPTQKPVALYAWLLKKYAEQGQTIIDTHLGSASSAIAASKLEFDFTGTEIDQQYYLSAQKRFKEQTAMPLFQ
jgi:site-specific DNA-methyltransferase (adenine-specific)